MLRIFAAVMASLVILSPAAMGQGSVVAHGGGADWRQESHREMVRWMIAQARASGDAAGDQEAPDPVRVVILGAVPREPGEPDAAADAFRREGAEAAALVILEDNADSPEVAAAIEAAQIVWIRGGSQSRYVEWWKGTATERAIREVFEKGGVVGGTSAGCAVLGEVTYDARNGSLRPEQALADSHHENLTLTHGFLNVVPGVLFDSHFTERGRIGRLPVMMGRARVDFERDVLGVGVDHGTAILINRDGRGRVVGQGWVTFLAWQAGSEADCAPGAPPRVTDLHATMLPSGGEYDLRNQRVLSPGVAPELMMEPIMFCNIAPRAGLNVVADAWVRGGVLARTEAAIRRPVELPHGCSVFIGRGVVVERDDDLNCRIGGDEGGPSALVFGVGDGARVSNSRSKSMAVIGARVHALPRGWAIRCIDGEIVRPATAR